MLNSHFSTTYFFKLQAINSFFPQASWHPGSPFDGHLMTLTSDNTLRIFNLDVEQESAEETIHLSEGSISNLFGKSALSVKGECNNRLQNSELSW